MNGLLATGVEPKLISLKEVSYQEKYVELTDYYSAKMSIKVLIALIYVLSAVRSLIGG